jgi:signal transduction histidine kinase
VGSLWVWGWLGIVHLVLDLLLSVPFLSVVALTFVGVATLPALGVGLTVLAVSLTLTMGIAPLERLRVLAFTGALLEAPSAPRPDAPLWKRVVLDARPWKATAYLCVVALWGLLAGTAVLGLICLALALTALPLYQGLLPGGRLSLPLNGEIDAAAWPWLSAAGLAGLLVVPLVARGLVAVDVALGRVFLARSRSAEVRELSQRVLTLTETRVAAVDSVEAERRRIERDLHDGPQQRLVALAMDLGMARQKLGTDPQAARGLLDRAHQAAKEAIVEMRQVARGIVPPVLTDRGLDAALSALAVRAPVPVDVRVTLPRRPSPTVEAIAYFCVSEALTNVAKHARARSVTVDVRLLDDELDIVVRDDGVGGADPTGGTGLTGLRDRARAVDGSLEISSPPGGPTQLTVRLPNRRADPAPQPTTQPPQPTTQPPQPTAQPPQPTAQPPQPTAQPPQPTPQDPRPTAVTPQDSPPQDPTGPEPGPTPRSTR